MAQRNTPPLKNVEGSYLYDKRENFRFVRAVPDAEAEELLGGSLYNKSYAPTAKDKNVVIYRHDYEYRMFTRIIPSTIMIVEVVENDIEFKIKGEGDTTRSFWDANEAINHLMNKHGNRFKITVESDS